MNRYEELKRHIDDFDLTALKVAEIGASIRDVCPLEFCAGFSEGECECCPSGWRWALRAEMKEDKS